MQKNPSAKTAHGGKSPSPTKSGPGRYHEQGKPGHPKPRGKGFKGVTFAPTL